MTKFEGLFYFCFLGLAVGSINLFLAYLLIGSYFCEICFLALEFFESLGNYFICFDSCCFFVLFKFFVCCYYGLVTSGSFTRFQVSFKVPFLVDSAFFRVVFLGFTVTVIFLNALL